MSKINPVPEALFTKIDIERDPLNLVACKKFGRKVRSGIGQNFDHDKPSPFYFWRIFSYIRWLFDFSCRTIPGRLHNSISCRSCCSRSELGIPYRFKCIQGKFAPNGTPKEVVETLGTGFEKTKRIRAF